MPRKQRKIRKPPQKSVKALQKAPNPKAADNLVRKGYKLHRAGKAREAEGLYRQALSKASRHADANNLFGLLCIQTRRIELAVKLIKRGLEEQPDNPQSHFNLAIALKDLGRLDEAEKHFRKCIALSPGNFEAISSLGIILRMQKKADEAIRCFRQALDLNPAYAEAHCNLGLAMVEQGETKRAESCLRQALKLKPELAEAHNGLAELYIDSGRYDQATIHIERALVTKPDFSDAINNRGVVLNKTGNTEAAMKHFQRAVEISPGSGKALMNLAIMLEQTGQLQEAAITFRNTIKARPDFADAHFMLAHLRNHQSTDEEIQAMQTLLERQDSSPEQRVHLAFGLAYAFESRQEYTESFEYLDMAHQLKSESLPFDLATEVQFFDAMERSFDADFVKRNSHSGVDDRRPLFIVGMPRSGTSLTEQILASHPQVLGAGEIGFLEGMAHEIREKTGAAYPLGCNRLNDGDLRKLGQKYIEQLDSLSTQAKYISNTTPANFLNLGLIAVVLPEARIINCLRDPMDNCLSIFKQLLSDAHAWSHKLEDLGAYYNLYRKLMNHWRQILPGRIYDLPYEALVADSEQEIRKLLDFCSLPFDERCLAFHQTRRAVRTPSASQVHQPLYTDTIELWKCYEQQLKPLQSILEQAAK
jgi:tetratricopeptide (TPR) repeat protein